MKLVPIRLPVVVKVLGIESGGIEIVARLLDETLRDVELIAVSRDAALLARCALGVKIHYKARDYDRSARPDPDGALEQALKNADLIVVAISEFDEPDIVPAIRAIARRMGVLVTAVASFPSTFAGRGASSEDRERRLRVLREGVDSLLLMQEETALYEILTALGA